MTNESADRHTPKTIHRGHNRNTLNDVSARPIDWSDLERFVHKRCRHAKGEKCSTHKES